MSDYRDFDQLKTDGLSIIRHGFFRPWFELTDGQFCYGNLSYSSPWKTTVNIETAQGNWVIKRKSIIGRTFFIQQPETMTVGTLTQDMLSMKVTLSMHDGFEASFSKKTMLSRSYYWTNYPYGDIVEITPALWSWKTPFQVIVDLNLLRSVPNIPLLTLLGLNLVLLRQAQAAH